MNGKYHVRVNSEARWFKSMGDAMQFILRAIEAKGTDPTLALPEKPNQRGPAWLFFPGRTSSRSIMAALEHEHPGDQRIVKRWRCSDEDLFFRKDRTAVLSNQWTSTKSFLPSIAQLNASVPGIEVQID